MNIMLENVELSFANLEEANDYNGDGKFKFDAIAIFPKGSKAEKLVTDTIAKAAEKKWPGRSTKGLKNPLKEGDEKVDAEGNIYDGYAGNSWIKGNNKSAPVLIKTSKQTFESGNIVNMGLDIYAHEGKFGKMVCCTLRGVQFVGEGIKRGGAIPMTAEEFPQLAGSILD